MSLYKLNFMSLILSGFDDSLSRAITNALCPAGLCIASISDHEIVASNESTIAVLRISENGFRVTKILKRTKNPQNAKILDERTPIPFNTVNKILKILDSHDARITEIKKNKGHLIIETDKNFTISVSYAYWNIKVLEP